MNIRRAALVSLVVGQVALALTLPASAGAPTGSFEIRMVANGQDVTTLRLPRTQWEFVDRVGYSCVYFNLIDSAGHRLAQVTIVASEGGYLRIVDRGGEEQQPQTTCPHDPPSYADATVPPDQSVTFTFVQSGTAVASLPLVGTGASWVPGDEPDEALMYHQGHFVAEAFIDILDPSVTLAGAPPPPPPPGPSLTITSFTPTAGPVGTVVAITGTYFSGTTAVAFNGRSAQAYTIDSDTRITATVPPTATTGPISVTTPDGTATSAASFTVGNSVHAGELTLRVDAQGRKHVKATGALTIPDGTDACRADRDVIVEQRVTDSGWEERGRITTSADGSFQGRVLGGLVYGTRRWRGRVEEDSLPNGDTCSPATAYAREHGDL